MHDEKKSSLKDVEPISTWSDDEPRAEGGSPSGPLATHRRTDMDPIPGTPEATPLVDEPGAREPRTSPETENELDRLRRG